MRALKSFLVIVGMGLLGVASLRANEFWTTPWNLSEPTEIPGMTLEPGKYMIKVVDSWETRMIVQITNPDQSKVFATVMAIPNYRPKSTGEGEFTYFQRAEGRPQALKTWFYPSNNYGVEFVYPKAEAIQIAQAHKEEVYTTESPKVDLREKVVILTPELKEEPLKVAPAPMVAEHIQKKLPRTASNVPLLAMIGLAAIAVAAFLRSRATRRTA